MRFEQVSAVQLSPNPAVGGFLSDFARVAAAYEYDWTQQDSFARRAAYLTQGGYRGDRAAVCRVLMRYNEALGAGDATLESIRRLEAADALVVVTGQQAGIFTGPVYSIYKAMTTILLARQQSERLGRPVVPLFWIAGEDHDWLEVARVLAPTGDTTVELALREPLEGDRRSVGLAPAPGSLYETIEAFIALLPDTEFKGAVAERIRGAAQGSPALPPELTNGRPSLADWFGRLLAWLFADTGLVFVNSSDPALRWLERSFFVRAIERQSAVEEACGRGCARFEAMGFTPTVERQPGQMNLFTYVDGERLPLVGDGERCWVRDRRDVSWAREALVAQAQSQPERFSTNVVLRPVIQGCLFPDLAYVGGPGEISYFGLLRDVYEVMNQQMPIVYPRLSYTLVEPPLARILEKHGLTVADALFRLDALRQEFIEREDRLGITDLFERFRTDFAAGYTGLTARILELDPGLQQVAEENRRQIAVQINKLEEKAKQQHRKNLEVALRQFDRLRAHLCPGGLQERALSILPYLAKYGPDLVQRLLAGAELGEGWAHQAIYL